MDEQDEAPARDGGTDRRSFLRLGALGGAAMMAGGSHGSPGAQEPAAATAPGADFELLEQGVTDLQRRMESGELTAARAIELYRERIATLDPMVASVIELNPDADAIARELDSERAAGRVRGPLHGIPILLKDNIDTADRMTTTAGSLALEGSVPTRDSTVARALRDAGAILLGKANMSEWANFRARPSSSGWSARGGQCRNPYVLDRSPCGSSSGSGVAAAASFCTAAIGTETDGSIVCPSSHCGLVGIKPTVGLVSRAGIIPISHSQDTAGPMARTVADAAAVLQVLTASDPRDAATLGRPGAAPPDYLASLDPGALRGRRLGIARKLFGFHAGVDQLMEDAIAALRDAGAVIVDPATFEPNEELGANEQEVLLYEFKADIAAYLATLGSPTQARTLDDLIRFNDENRDREMPYFGQERFLASAAKGPLTDPAYVNALETSRRLSRGEGIDAALDRERLDAIVAPTGAPAWTIDLVNGDHFMGGSSSYPAVAGYPNVTVPAGMVHGLPVGISFFGRAWSEATLIGIAYAFEQATRHRRAPTFRATVESL